MCSLVLCNGRLTWTGDGCVPWFGQSGHHTWTETLLSGTCKWPCSSDSPYTVAPHTSSPSTSHPWNCRCQNLSKKIDNPKTLSYTEYFSRRMARNIHLICTSKISHMSKKFLLQHVLVLEHVLPVPFRLPYFNIQMEKMFCFAYQWHHMSSQNPKWWNCRHSCWQSIDSSNFRMACKLQITL